MNISNHVRASSAKNFKTYVREENTGDASSGMDPFLVALLLIGTTLKTPMMAGHRVLMRLNTAFVRRIDGSAKSLILFPRTTRLLLPAERQVSGRHDLDKVHVVVCLLIGVLFGVVKRVDMVVRPSTGGRALVFPLHILDNHIAELRAKTKLVNAMSEGMRVLVLEVVLEIVDVQVAVGKGLSGSNVEVSDNLVDTDTALKTTSFLALLVEVFGVVFALTLFYPFSTTEGPRYRSISIADFVTGIAAAGFDRVGGRRCAVTFAAIVGGQM
jgi:hypothetical protein